MPPSSPASAPPEFDEFADNYDAALNRGLALSGENKTFFIQGRLRWLRRCLAKIEGGHCVQCVLDYGCGTGASFSHFQNELGAHSVIGVDVSTAELAIARKDYPWARLYPPQDVPPETVVDLAYSNGTFHHIPPAQRLGALQLIFHSLKPGGLFALWENNPWNPGTRWIMSRVPFDRDAITLTPPETRRLVRQAGFELIRTDFLFVFPRFLAPFRTLEPALSRLPFGAQYQVLCRRPVAS